MIGETNPEETRLGLANAGPIANAALYNNGKELADAITKAGGVMPGPPTGAAGGVLGGTYPNPGFANPVTQNLPIENASPSLTLRTTGSLTANSPTLSLGNTSVPPGTNALQLSYDPSTGNSAVRANGGTLTLGAGTAGSFTATLDTGGRLGLPNQPAFNAYGVTSWNARGASSEVAVPFDGVTLNRGNHYNTANGRFTAPVAGYYFFAANLRLDSTGAGNYLRYGIKRNNLGNFWNTVYGHAHAIQGNNHPTDYNTLPISTVMYLNASDYVWCCCFHVSTGGNVLMSESNFSGCLLG